MPQLYARVFLKVLDSSIAEDFTLRHVFEDFLKLAEDGVVDMTRESLARRLNIPLDTLNACITRLESPDPKSRNPAHEGRRIDRIDEHRDWGWIILNWSEYEEIRSKEIARQKTAERVRRHRAKHGEHPSPTPPSQPQPQTQTQTQTQSVTASNAAPVTEALPDPPESQGAFREIMGESPHKAPRGSNGKPQVGCRNAPSIGELELYASKIGLPVSEATSFFDYYESNGWVVGKARAPMRSWQGAMRHWKTNWERIRSQPSGLPTMNIKRGVDTLEDQLERERRIWEKL